MDTYPKSRAHYSLVHQVRGWYSGVELKMSRRQAAGAYLNRYVTDEQRSRRLIFSSTPWAVQSWRFLGVARSTRISLDTGLRSRLPKSPTLRRRRYTSLGLGALIWIVAIVLLAGGHGACADDKPDWIRLLTSDKGPGNFAAPPSMRLFYRFGWSGIQAATADIHFFSPTRNTFEVDASGATSGFPRTLFRLDIYHQATENKDTLMPIHFFQEEKYRQETVKTNVDFKPDYVTGLRERIPSDHPSKPNVFRFSPVFDLTTALLWVRSSEE